ncbi:MAG: MarC family protein [Candidatus Omnitrophica bacterium]|nr:MarC family protein [Candidatus Omnitrophota bacterium]
MTDQILLAFIPMFFAMDPIGILAIFSGLTQDLTIDQKRRIIIQSLMTASLVAIGFIFLGKAIFNFLGISMGDFMIAGGVILFCLSMVDMLGQESATRNPKSVDIGAVPIGTPLIVGPAVLTMALMLTNQFGSGIALIAVLSNIAIVAVVFFFSDILIRLLGTSGSRALSKVMALLLAAIGVMMIRKGVIEIISSLK